MSVSTSGAQGNALSSVSDPTPISADGRFVVFYSSADNLVSGDTNGAQDIFIRDRKTHRTTRVSIGSGGSLTVGPWRSGGTAEVERR